jgi:hypothetical protein
MTSENEEENLQIFLAFDILHSHIHISIDLRNLLEARERLGGDVVFVK